MIFLGQGAAYLVAPHQPGSRTRAAMTRIRTPRRNTAMRVARMLAAEPDVVEDARVARLIKSDLIDLDTRLMAAPYEIGAETPVSATCFRLEQLRAEMELGSTVGPIAIQMCEQLRRNHFAIVLPDEAGQAALHGVWQAARDFFDLTAEDKESIAGCVKPSCPGASAHATTHPSNH